MRVKARLFARLRDLAGSSDLDVEVTEGATIAEVWTALVERQPALAPYGKSMSVARNLEYVRPTTRVEEGDEVAFMPPVSGG